MAWKRDRAGEAAMLVAARGAGLPEDQEWPGVAPQAYSKGDLLFALVSRDEIAKDDQRWHISLRHKSRIPTWEELVMAGHELRPGVVFVIGLPPKSWWINVHPHVLHL